MTNPVQDFEDSLLVQRVAARKEASNAMSRLREVLREASWHQEYVSVRQEDLREVLKMPAVK